MITFTATDDGAPPLSSAMGTPVSVMTNLTPSRRADQIVATIDDLERNNGRAHEWRSWTRK